MKHIRAFLLSILGLRRYLELISAVYIHFVTKGFWKKKYPELFYLDSIITEGNVCIDIGANLGYYSTRLARLVGTTGKVYAIEPIPLFGDIWIKNVKPEQNQQAMLLPFALGKEKGTVQMGMPTKNGRLHHGMTKIASSAQEQYVHMFDVDMQNPDELFADIPALDFIKCDVEGYESVVFDNMQHTISRFRPLVQTELSGDENRQHVIDFFTSRNYSCAVLQNNSLIPISKNDAMKYSQDFYFIPK